MGKVTEKAFNKTVKYFCLLFVQPFLGGYKVCVTAKYSSLGSVDPAHSILLARMAHNPSVPISLGWPQGETFQSQWYRAE